MTQISKQFQLVFQEQIILTVSVLSEFGQLHPLPALSGRHINNSGLLANFLSQICIVNTVLLQKEEITASWNETQFQIKCTKSWILGISESASNNLSQNIS